MSHTSMPNLRLLHDFTVDLARRAGQLILASSLSRTAQQSASSADAWKKNRVDLVTETDLAVERFVRSEIAQRYPSHAFIGEESDAGGVISNFSSAPTWIVDPIDGTTNFVHGFPEVCISIGFVFEKMPVVGVIFNPFHDRLYSSIQGQGSHLNSDLRLPLSHPAPPPLASLSDALIGVEWGSDRGERIMALRTRSFLKLAGDGREIPSAVMAHSLRSIGSAALNFAYVAQGALDLYWEIGCKSWDVAAGISIAREAGAKVFGKGGKELELDDLTKQHFCVVRAIGDTSTEKGVDAQNRIAKEFFAVIEEWDV